jgi:hypothetical protein
MAVSPSLMYFKELVYDGSTSKLWGEPCKTHHPEVGVTIFKPLFGLVHLHLRHFEMFLQVVEESASCGGGGEEGGKWGRKGG